MRGIDDVQERIKEYDWHSVDDGYVDWEFLKQNDMLSEAHRFASLSPSGMTISSC